MTKHTQILLALHALAMLSACDEFDPGSLIEDTRVLGATVSVVGDAERASPLPGESAEVRFIVTNPDDVPTLRWAFVACTVKSDGSCGEPQLGPFQGESAAPAFQLDVPDEGELGDAPALRVMGIVCDDGAPALDDQGMPECSGKDAHGTAVTLDVSIGRTGQVNHNPRIGDTSVGLDGETFASRTGDVGFGSCAGDDSLPQLEANGKDHKLSLELDASVRELYREENDPSEQLEDLQISQFATAGELEDQFLFVEEDVAGVNPHVEQNWTAPEAEEVDEGGELVRFIFVVRDQRGGVAVTERALCVTP